MTIRVNLFPDNTTDANFRAWGSQISTALSTFGWVQTADTGQINWATVTHPTLANTFQGFEIWKMGDALTAAYIKIRYGSGSVAANPAIEITTGTGSNGTGTLTNASSARVIQVAGANAVTQFDCVLSGGNARFSMIMFRAATNSGASAIGSFQVCIERSHDINGGDTNEFIQVVMASNQSSTMFQWEHILVTGVTGTTETAQLRTYYTTQATTVSNGYVGVFPVFPLINGYVRNPMKGMCCLRAADWTEGDNPSFDIYPGDLHAYIVCKTATAAFGSSSGGWACASRFD